MPRDAKVIVDAYRSAVEGLVEARFDWMLTFAHVDRSGRDAEYAARCDLIARELRARTEPFRSIEPQWFAAMEKRAHDRFVVRDERNMALESSRRKRGENP